MTELKENILIFIKEVKTISSIDRGFRHLKTEALCVLVY